MGLKIGLSVVLLSALLLGGCDGDKSHHHDHGAHMMLEDKAAISDVLIRYATSIDQRDWTMFRTCFTEDVTLDYDSGIGTYKGREVFTKRFEEGHAKIGPTMHKLTNFVINVDGDKATAKSYVDALLMPLEAGGHVRRANGFYEDTLVREKDGWKIASRKFTTVQILDTPS
jgi:hypothetical protein